MTNEENIIEITHAGKKYRIIFTDDVQDIDAQDIVTIHYNNIIAEYIIFPVVLQRIGNLLAVAKNKLAYSKAGFEYTEAELRKKYRLEYEVNTEEDDALNLTPTGKISKTIKPAKKTKPTAQELTDLIILDSDYNEGKEKVIIDESVVNKLESLYWSCKAKYDAVGTISSKLSPEEFKLDLIRERLVKLHSYGCEVEKMGDF